LSFSLHAEEEVPGVSVPTLTTFGGFPDPRCQGNWVFAIADVSLNSFVVPR
jgi:hypothetical protein